MDSTTYDLWIKKSLEQLRSYVNTDEYHGIQLRLSKKETNESEFLQGVSELCTILHCINAPVSDATFPRRKKKNGKDIDISYIYNRQRINIEVKCPDSSKRLKRLREAEYQLYTSDSFSSISEHTQAVERATKGMDVGVGGNDIVKLTGEKGFLNNCSGKFDEVSTSGDFNAILLSLSSLEELDEWRRKVENENVLDNYKNIHAVILSSIAHDHLKIIEGETRCRLRLEDTLNYIIPNQHHPRSIPIDSMGALFESFPNNTVEINRWYKIHRSSPTDPLGILQVVKLAHYYKTDFGG